MKIKYGDNDKIEEQVYQDISILGKKLVKGVGEVENCPTAIKVVDKEGIESYIDTFGDFGC